MSKEERKRRLNICFWLVMIVAALAFLSIGYIMLKAVKSETAEASAVKTVQETEAEVEEEEELVFADEPYDGVIPTIQIEGEVVPLGVALPPSEIAYDPDDPEAKPLFLYTHPERWEEIYEVKGTSRYVVHVDKYYMEVSIWGPIGPVWKFTSYSGVLCGVTDHTFLFEQNGKTYAVEQGSVSMGVTHLFEELPLAEQNTKVEAAEVTFIPAANVQLNSFYDVDFTPVEGTGIWVEMPEATVSRPEMIFVQEESSVHWYQYRDGRMFFTQRNYSSAPNEAVFYGGIDGCMTVLHIPFDGDFHGADAYGITYEREGTLYFKSFYGFNVNGKPKYFEIPACLRSWGLELPREIWGDRDESSIEAEMQPPFLAE